MITDNLSRVDLLRIMQKRATAIQSLNEYRKWQDPSDKNQHVRVLVFGLLRDITRGTEEEIDYLIEKLDQFNSTQVMKKIKL